MPKQKSSIAPSPSASSTLSIVLSIAMCALTLMGCQSPMPPSTEARAPLPSNLTSPCPPLNQLSDGTGGSVLRLIVEVSEQYYECARKHRALVDAVK